VRGRLTFVTRRSRGKNACREPGDARPVLLHRNVPGERGQKYVERQFVTKPTTREGISEALAKIKDFSQPRRRRLLVVEGNVAEQMSIHELLGHDDIEIINASTGQEALDLLRREVCACVVLDLRLPDMSGFEVLECMRAEAALADVPVVVFTGRELSANEDAQLHTMARSIAKAMTGDREKCLEAGVSDYLAKPVNTEQLLSALRMWLHC